MNQERDDIFISDGQEEDQGRDSGLGLCPPSGLEVLIYRREIRSDWLDGQPEILYDGCEELTGYSAELFRSGEISYWDCIDPSHRGRVRETLKLKAKTGEPVNLEYKIRTKSGAPKWVWERAFFYQGEEGGGSYVKGVITDISERRQAELELRHGNRLLGGLSLVQSLLLQGLPIHSVFSEMLAVLLDVTQSEAGFLSEVIQKPGAGPCLRAWAISSKAWSSTEKRNASEMVANGMEFAELDSYLFGDVVKSGRPILLEHPGEDPKKAGFPYGHFELKSFMAIPIYFRDKLIGVAAVANRKGGYNEDMNGWLEPYLMGFAAALDAYYTRERQLLAERSLRESERRYDTLSAMAPVGILHIDPEGKCVFVNEKLCQLADKRSAEVRGKGYLDLLHPKHREAVADGIHSALTRGQMVSLEARILGPDEKAIWVLIHAVPEAHGEAQSPGAIVSFTDISERKHWEFVLRSIVEGLTGKTGRLYINSLVLYVAKVLNIDFVGLSVLVPGIPGRGKTMVICQSGDIQPNFEYNLIGSPCERVFSGDSAAIPKDVRKEFPQAMLIHEFDIDGYVGVPLFDPDRKVMGILFVMHRKSIENIHFVQDILGIFASRAGAELFRMAAEQKINALNRDLEKRVIERTHELSAANAELARAARLKDEFLATMSHELRTPLNAILGMSEALLDELYGHLDDRLAKPIKSIFESGQHLLSLINDILDISKIEAGRIGLEIAPTPVAPICESSVRLVREQAQKKRLRLSLSMDSSVSIVWSDGRRLKQMLVNLLTNAVKFTPDGGEVGLSVSLEPAREAVSFCVWDTGIGIAPADFNRIFEPFFQIDSGLSRVQGGTGLGLSLVRRLAEAHGGSIHVESTPDQGSRFTIYLPLPPPEEGAPISRRIAAITRETPTEYIKIPVVMIADDHEITLATLNDYLVSKGYRVILARDGEEAVECALENKPDIVLMDVQMAKMNGLRAMERIRADKRTADIPMIALTALSMPGDKERCLHAGANAYLTKPVPPRTIVSTIESLLSSRTPSN